VLISLFLFAANTYADKEKMSRETYIQKYKELAIGEMKRSGIPASITMAQALLESGNGNSTLATKANNHFGIKCHKSWKGKTIKHDDDKRNECFRRYKKASESYRDHSDFLINGSRYQFLFDYRIQDYKSWAKGLKKAGYATDKRYASSLIRIIEDYQLYQLDKGNYNIKNFVPKSKRKNKELVNDVDEFIIDIYNQRKVYKRNRIDYIIAQEGDSFKSLSEELEMMTWQFRKYNNISKKHNFKEGEVVYLQPKRRKAEIGHDTHIVLGGETMLDISQMYGVKIKSLYKKNDIAVGDQPVAGTELNLR